MATLTAAQLQEVRSLAASAVATVTWTKPQINAAIQAVEDAMASASNVGGKSVQAYIGGAIETAAPGVFSAPQKQTLFALWCVRYAYRQGVLS